MIIGDSDQFIFAPDVAAAANILLLLPPLQGEAVARKTLKFKIPTTLNILMICFSLCLCFCFLVILDSDAKPANVNSLTM